jgi:signal transduction histidine kinase
VNPSSADQETKKTSSDNKSNESLTTALHSAVHRAAKQTQGGVAILFTVNRTTEGRTGQPQLRLAAGFATPEEAQNAAQAVYPIAEQCLQTGEIQRETTKGEGEDGEEANTSELVAFPTNFSNRLHGTLVIGSPVPVVEQSKLQLTMLCNTVALLLDQASLESEVEDLKTKLSEMPPPGKEEATQNPDELLALSEALFSQDLEVIQKDEMMVKVERLKSDFIEKMSCELRTPLNNIIESIISVIANEGDTLSNEAKNLLRSALDDGSTFQRTLESILELWRLRQDELTVVVQEVSFPEVVDEAIFSVQDTLGDKPVHISLQLQDPFPRIKIDLAKLSQIIFMLLDNAVKFTPSGTVTIRASVDGSSNLVCEISDTGIGICPEDLGLIYDEFYQVDDTSSTKYRGSGLGLTLTKELLSLLHGSIRAESDVGHGSEFHFQLPVTLVDS